MSFWAHGSVFVGCVVYLVLNLFDGYRANGVYYQRLVGGVPEPEVIRLLDAWDGLYQFLGNDEDTFYFKTTHDAPLGRIVAIDLSNPAPDDWRTIVPQSDLSIEAATLVGRTFICLPDLRRRCASMDA